MYSAGELDASEEISSEFVVARGDGTKVLQFIEEALDEIALAVEVRSRRSVASCGWPGGLTAAMSR